MFELLGATSSKPRVPMLGLVTELVTLPIDLSYSGGGPIALIDDTVYLFGGGNRSNRFFKYHIPTNIWTEIPATGTWPVGVYGATLTAIDRMLYLYGGYSATGISGQFLRYSLATETWETLAPGIGSQSHSGIAYQGNLWVTGGSPATLRQYNPKTNQWSTKLSSSYLGGVGMALAIYENTLYLAGGHYSVSVDQLLKYNFLDNTLERVSGISTGVRNGAGFVFKGELGFIFGGSWSTGVGDFRVFNPISSEVTLMTPSVPRNFTSSIWFFWYNNSIIFELGNKLWIFDPFAT